MLILATDAMAIGGNSYKTIIGTCECGIDDYKCDTSDGSCNVRSQSICEEDCKDEDMQ